jgi:pimeloyl-ACP methyl ester carboxylesterase
MKTRTFILGAAAGSVLVTTLLAAAPVRHTESPLAGDWAGWAYFDNDRGDTPLRLRVVSSGPSLVARFDEVPSKQYDLPAHASLSPSGQVSIDRERPNGQHISLSGKLQGDIITGTLQWVTLKGHFELIRSAEPIARIPPEAFRDLKGVYQLGPERALVISMREWGELLYTDLGAGQQGTLFSVDRDSFFVGGAMYTPRPVTAHVRFLRTDGQVQGVEWKSVGGETLHGDHVAFREEDITFRNGAVELSGTLIRPAVDGALPAIVVICGSNWTDRSACRRDGDLFPAFGVASFVFDRRGFGKSGGNRVHSFSDDADDALQAIATLRARPDIRKDDVGISGRSQGGWISPLAASRSADVHFMVLFVAPAVSPAEQEMTRRTHELEDAGFDAKSLAREREMFQQAIDYSISRRGWDRYSALRKEAKAAGIPDDVLEDEDQKSDDWEWGRLHWRYDPIPALEKVHCPVIALFGGADRNVVVADNLPPMKAALERAGNRDVTLLVVPGAAHSLLSVPTGKDAPPLHRLTGGGTQGWPDVARWLLTRVRHGGDRSGSAP